MELSIVTTLYRSESFLETFYARVTAAANRMTVDYEIIFVNDGSPDASLQRVLQLVPHDPRVRVIDLSRNFGHHLAISAGLGFSKGKRIFVIDCDLEEDPEWIEPFWKEMDRTEADVVYGVQMARRGSFFSVFTARMFYRVFNFMSEVKIVPDACTVRLMSRRYVEALLTLRDKALFLAGNFAWTGFVQQPFPVNKQQRRGLSSYSFFRRISLLVDAITSFSAYPLKLILVIGTLISFFGGAFGLVLIVEKLLNPNSVLLGYTSLMASVWFLGGIVIAFLGVIGIYLSTAFSELKDRPTYIVRGVHGEGRSAGEAKGVVPAATPAGGDQR